MSVGPGGHIVMYVELEVSLINIPYMHRVHSVYFQYTSLGNTYFLLGDALALVNNQMAFIPT